MRLRTLIAATALVLAIAAQSASAQDVHAMTFAGVTGDINDQSYPAFGGGVLVGLGQPWLSLGAQGELFTSWPYLNGRAAVFGQGNLAPRKMIRPFVIAGVGLSEYSGPMFGGGVEMNVPNRRVGFRVALEDYTVRIVEIDGRTTRHQVAFRAGILF